MKCLKCNSEIPDGAKFCAYCGSQVGQQQTQQGQYQQSQQGNNDSISSGLKGVGNKLSTGTKNRIITILLAFFLGDFGGQFFYLRKYWLGVLCLLFFWTWIPCIWGVVHAIIFLSMSDEEFNLKYNQ